MNAVHAALLAEPTCGKDKWLDAHHAYDSSASGRGNCMLAYLESHPEAYYYCQPGSNGSYALHYMIDPTGWGIQVDETFTSQPSGCSASALDALGSSTYNPACDLGLC